MMTCTYNLWIGLVIEEKMREKNLMEDARIHEQKRFLFSANV